jgi:hypothetical protein
MKHFTKIQGLIMLRCVVEEDRKTYTKPKSFKAIATKLGSAEGAMSLHDVLLD